MEFRRKSLGVIITAASTGRCTFYRLADIEAGQLVEYKDNEEIKGHLSQIHKAPIIKNGCVNNYVIGVWEWIVKPNKYNVDKEYFEISISSEIMPKPVIFLYDLDYKVAVELLKKGKIRWQSKLDVVIVYKNITDNNTPYRGLYCTEKDYEIIDGYIHLHKDVFCLREYLFSEKDLFFCEDNRNKKRIFLKNLLLPKEYNLQVVGDELSVIKSCLIDAFNSDVWKRRLSISEKYYKNYIDILNDLINDEFMESLSKKLFCTIKESREVLEEHRDAIESLGNDVAVEEDIVALLIENNQRLQEYCIGKGGELWKSQNKAIIDIKEEVLAKLMLQIQEKEKLQNQLVDKINSLQDEVKRMESLVEDKYKEYEECERLGNILKKETQNNILEAKNNMESFLVKVLEEYSISNVFGNRLDSSSKQLVSKQWCLEESKLFDLDMIDVVEDGDVENPVMLFKENLKDCCDDINSDAAAVLANIVGYNVINNQDILLLGMNSVEIAQIIALTFTGRMAPVISCFGDENWEVLSSIKDSPIVIVKNALSSSWKTQASVMLGQRKEMHCFIWVEEFEDSLVMESRDILNYVTPIFLNAFLSPSIHFDDFRRLNNSSSLEVNNNYSRRNKFNRRIYKQIGKGFNWKQFCGSQFYCKRITGLISYLVNEFSEREEEVLVKDISVVFGLLPLAMIGNKQNKLGELINDKSISDWVRSILEDYVEEE